MNASQVANTVQGSSNWTEGAIAADQSKLLLAEVATFCKLAVVTQQKRQGKTSWSPDVCQ